MWNKTASSSLDASIHALPALLSKTQPPKPQTLTRETLIPDPQTSSPLGVLGVTPRVSRGLTYCAFPLILSSIKRSVSPTKPQTSNHKP